LADVLLEQFEDADGGGFFFTAKDHEKLIHRSKTFGDESLPSGNGVAASVLCRLGYLLGELPYLDAAERTLKAAWRGIQDYPQAHMSLVNALEDFLSSMQILVIRGDEPSAKQWAMDLGSLYAPTRMIFAIPARRRWRICRKSCGRSNCGSPRVSDGERSSAEGLGHPRTVKVTVPRRTACAAPTRRGA
jgi:uncharacterized protein YyaL (SSP411 family)